MTPNCPDLENFRIESGRDGLIHFVFDMPNRTMNVFSDAAIQDLATFAEWLGQSDVRGVLMRSGKQSAFCAGADLGELGVAYEMIEATRPQNRFKLAFDHFFRLSSAIRSLETAGKPVAVAVAGLALGGGCELALGAHYRVLADHPKAALGLPEALVGLLPGGGGTQRMPRLVGAQNALPILLDGQRLAGQPALDAGVVDRLCAPGEEVATAEAWLLSEPVAMQPWDLSPCPKASRAEIADIIDPVRLRVLRDTLGHYPAPLAILDCIEQGLVQPFDTAIRTEMSIFTHLIQRAEPRNMIQTLFLGRTDYERAAKTDSVSKQVIAAVRAVQDVLKETASNCAVISPSNVGVETDDAALHHSAAKNGFWFERQSCPEAIASARRFRAVAAAAAALADQLTSSEQRQVDFLVVSSGAIPSYLGGPFALARYFAGRIT